MLSQKRRLQSRESARGLAQSKTLARGSEAPHSGEAFGVRQPSAAFSKSFNLRERRHPACAASRLENNLTARRYDFCGHNPRRDRPSAPCSQRFGQQDGLLRLFLCRFGRAREELYRTLAVPIQELASDKARTAGAEASPADKLARLGGRPVKPSPNLPQLVRQSLRPSV